MTIYKVYKVTNRLNGKIYVGQTKQSLEKRFMQHLHANSPLGQAMRQCGAENFTIEVIEYCETQEQLNERERFWIKVLNCKIPVGYNVANGGGGSNKTTKLIIINNDIENNIGFAGQLKKNKKTTRTHAIRIGRSFGDYTTSGSKVGTRQIRP